MMSGPVLYSPISVLHINRGLAEYIKNLKLYLPNNNSQDLPPNLKKILPNVSKQFLE
jgi:hypothetical protein